MIFTNKIVLVTGGAQRIGRSICLNYALHGATVIFCDIEKEAGKELENYMFTQGFIAEFIETDLSKEEQIDSMFKYITKKYAQIDILVNAASIFNQKPLLETTSSDWDHVMNTNLKSIFLCSKYFLKLKGTRKFGRIINISSTRFIMSQKDTYAYSASKGAVVSLTHSLAVSLSEENVTVNCISPGRIDTKVKEIDLKDDFELSSQRVGLPEDVARACLFLTDPKNSFINGQNLILDGGMTKTMPQI